MNFSFIGDIFFPRACVGCGDSVAAGVVCEPCMGGIDMFDSLFCGTCMARLPELKKICHPRTPYILGAAGRYDDTVLNPLIHTFKFEGTRDASMPLARVLIEYVSRLGINLDTFLVVPMPLSAKRHRARGFNQAALIARSFADAKKLPFDEHILIRSQHRKPQSSTQDIFERRENIRGCYSLGSEIPAENRNMIIIDDVTTSGATFMEAARILKAGGAKKIIALAVARA